jgi:carboxylesterase
MTIQDQSYYIAGGRTGVLLMHGLSGSPTEMRFVADGLARAGYTVYCPHLAGHGGSEADNEQTTWQDWYASAEQALARLRQECDVVVVGGLSTGAVLALQLAARHPEHVHGTALIAPTFWQNGWLTPWYARLLRIIPSKRIANLIGFPDLHGINAVRAEIGDIRQPALIIQGREDDYADLDAAWYLQRNLKGLVDMIVLDASYRIGTVDRQRHLMVERIATHVGSVAKGMQAISAKARDRVPTSACAAA